MADTVRLPAFGRNLTEGVLVAVDKAPGESFVAGEPLFEVEIKKVVFEVTADDDGTVKNILISVGDPVSVGAPVMQVEYREAVA